jgi:hypothetical protein
MIGLILFCESKKRISEILSMKTPHDVEEITQSMIGSGEITEDIETLFLKMIRNTKDIIISLEEVKTKIKQMIIG